MKRILRLLAAGLAAVILAGGPAAAALAQDEPVAEGYSNVHIWVNPEYDDPSLLIMMQGNIVGVTPPATVQFLVPTSAEMYSAGSMDINNNYTGGPPDRTASEILGWDLISYTVTSNIFRVEYYDNTVIMGAPDKTIDYEFMSPLPITNLTVSVQQPRKATDFAVEPAGAAGQDAEGFNIQTYTYGTVAPLDALGWRISYYKGDNVPSLQQNTGAGAPAASTGGSGGGVSNGGLAAIIIVVVAAAALIVFFMMQRSRPMTRADRRRRGAMPSRAAGGNRQPGNRAQPGGGSRQAPAGAARFCTNCGASLEPSAKFCPECGTPRR